MVEFTYTTLWPLMYFVRLYYPVLMKYSTRGNRWPVRAVMDKCCTSEVNYNSYNSKVLFLCFHSHWWIQGGGIPHHQPPPPPRPLSVQFLLISYSFRGEMAKTMGWRPHFWLWHPLPSWKYQIKTKLESNWNKALIYIVEDVAFSYWTFIIFR